MANKINILIVDDSPTIVRFLEDIFSKEHDFNVVGCANNGQEAIDMAKAMKPDIITMDVNMPVMDGISATKHIMANNPTPIVVISSTVDTVEVKKNMRIFEVGALAIVKKLPSFQSDEFKNEHLAMINTIRAMSEIKLIKRAVPATCSIGHLNVACDYEKQQYDLLAVGASTGGPVALQAILSGLSVDFPLPVLVVQHIAPGFANGLTSWLNDSTPLRVKLGETGEFLQPGTVYIAPDNMHMKVENYKNNCVLSLDSDQLDNNFIPSISVLFESVALNFPNRAIGLLLTGMGSDGANGLLQMRQAGCHTLVQDESSSVVFGMPAAAIDIKASENIICLPKISEYLINLVSYVTSDS